MQKLLTIVLLITGLAWAQACDSDAGPADATVVADTSQPADAAAPPADAADTAEPPADSSPAVDVADTAGPQDSQAPPADAADTAEPGDTAVMDTDAPDTTDVGVVLPTEPPPIEATYETFIGDWDLKPGDENTRCVVKRLNNETEIWVSRIRTLLNEGSHHLIVYKSNETEERLQPFSCTPFIETLKDQTFPLMITQIREETLAFPNGVAFRFEPNQMIRIEAHYLNYFSEDKTAHADVAFDTIAADDVVSEANMLF